MSITEKVQKIVDLTIQVCNELQQQQILPKFNPFNLDRFDSHMLTLSLKKINSITKNEEFQASDDEKLFLQNDKNFVQFNRLYPNKVEDKLYSDQREIRKLIPDDKQIEEIIMTIKQSLIFSELLEECLKLGILDKEKFERYASDFFRSVIIEIVNSDEEFNFPLIKKIQRKFQVLIEKGEDFRVIELWVEGIELNESSTLVCSDFCIRTIEEQDFYFDIQHPKDLYEALSMPSRGLEKFPHLFQVLSKLSIFEFHVKNDHYLEATDLLITVFSLYKVGSIKPVRLIVSSFQEGDSNKISSLDHYKERIYIGRENISYYSYQVNESNIEPMKLFLQRMQKHYFDYTHPPLNRRIARSFVTYLSILNNKDFIEEKILRAIISLETLLLFQEDGELKFKLKNRAAKLISLVKRKIELIDPLFDPNEISFIIGKSYNLRSLMVHEGGYEHSGEFEELSSMLRKLLEYLRLILIVMMQESEKCLEKMPSKDYEGKENEFKKDLKAVQKKNESFFKKMLEEVDETLICKDKEESFLESYFENILFYE